MVRILSQRMVAFPERTAIANVSYEASTSPSNGDSSVHCMSGFGPIPAVQAMKFTHERPTATCDPELPFELRTRQGPLLKQDLNQPGTNPNRGRTIRTNACRWPAPHPQIEVSDGLFDRNQI